MDQKCFSVGLRYTPPPHKQNMKFSRKCQSEMLNPTLNKIKIIFTKNMCINKMRSSSFYFSFQIAIKTIHKQVKVKYAIH